MMGYMQTSPFKKPNHFASVCKSSQKCPIKQLTELSDAEQETDTDTDTDEFFYKVEEVSSVQARGKQFYACLNSAILMRDTRQN